MTKKLSSPPKAPSQKPDANRASARTLINLVTGYAEAAGVGVPGQGSGLHRKLLGAQSGPYAVLLLSYPVPPTRLGEACPDCAPPRMASAGTPIKLSLNTHRAAGVDSRQPDDIFYRAISQSSNSMSTASVPTTSLGFTKMRFTVPSRSAATSFSIFIAS